MHVLPLLVSVCSGKMECAHGAASSEDVLVLPFQLQPQRLLHLVQILLHSKCSGIYSLGGSHWNQILVSPTEGAQSHCVTRRGRV